MGQIMSVSMAVQLSPDAGHPCVIYAQRPWNHDANAIICFVNEVDKSNATIPGFDYFLECVIVSEILEGIKDQTTFEQVQRVIRYAENDA